MSAVLLRAVALVAVALTLLTAAVSTADGTTPVMRWPASAAAASGRSTAKLSPTDAADQRNARNTQILAAELWQLRIRAATVLRRSISEVSISCVDHPVNGGSWNCVIFAATSSAGEGSSTVIVGTCRLATCTWEETADTHNLPRARFTTRFGAASLSAVGAEADCGNTRWPWGVTTALHIVGTDCRTMKSWLTSLYNRHERPGSDWPKCTRTDAYWDCWNADSYLRSTVSFSVDRLSNGDCGSVRANHVTYRLSVRAMSCAAAYELLAEYVAHHLDPPGFKCLPDATCVQTDKLYDAVRFAAVRLK